MGTNRQSVAIYDGRMWGSYFLDQSCCAAVSSSDGDGRCYAEQVGELRPTTTRYSGLLAAGKDTVGARLEVAVDARAPYLNLPRSTCDAIAAHLPVTYSSDLGLYL
ncbi:hypothetical protein DL769_001956 [Monosporascus sp. CRB-8-3]|nr:hypothetical protein DL769_001956 [Monosporascus sp. CRB-8-3]